MHISFKDLNVDLRLMPRYFWWGLGLETVGAAGGVLCAPHMRFLSAVFFTVLAVGFVLCWAGFSAARRRRDAQAPEEADQA
jgi:hypothetical protein